MPHSAFRVVYEEFNVPRTKKVGEKVLAELFGLLVALLWL